MVAREPESQLWAGKFLRLAELSKAGKDYESATEGWECFLKEEMA